MDVGLRPLNDRVRVGWLLATIAAATSRGGCKQPPYRDGSEHTETILKMSTRPEICPCSEYPERNADKTAPAVYRDRMKWKPRSIHRLWMREDDPNRIDWAAVIVLCLYSLLFLLLFIPIILAFAWGGLPDRGAGFR